MKWEKPDRTIEFQIKFDVIDAAIHRCLTNTDQSFVDFERKEVTQATVIYELTQWQLGNVGRIRIDKLSNERVEMALFESLEPLSKQQKREYLESEDIHKKKLAQAISQGLDQDKSFIALRKKHYRDVMHNLLYRLGRESIWTDEELESEHNAKIRAGDDSTVIGRDVSDSTIINARDSVIHLNVESKSKRGKKTKHP
jgi:hypothetical protein